MTDERLAEIQAVAQRFSPCATTHVQDWRDYQTHQMCNSIYSVKVPYQADKGDTERQLASLPSLILELLAEVRRLQELSVHML